MRSAVTGTRAKRVRVAAILVLAAACAAVQAADGAYPVKPIRVVVPFAPGGATDILVRTVAQRLSEQLGQSLVIDNRGGGGGAIGATLAARAAPDGYTFMATTSGVVVVNQSLYRKLAYDPIADFVPVTIIASLPNMLVVNPSFAAGSVKDLIALARAKPGALTYASGGNGTSNHLAGELLKFLAGVNLTHVPYKGGGPAVLATMSGEVSMLFATMPSAIPQVKAGKLKALATTSSKRLLVLPELATVAESGYLGFQSTAWVGLLAPAGTPKAIVEQINAAVLKVMALPETRERMAGFGAEITTSTPDEFAAHIRSEMAKLGKVIRDANIKVN